MDSKSTEQKLRVLTHQNQQLAVQLEEKRKTSKALEDKVAAYEQKEQEYEQTLLCVNRIWSQFTVAISHLCTSLAGHADLRPPATPSGAAAAKPLLDAQKRVDAELTDVELALQERARGCKDALAAVLDAVRSIHTRQEELSARLREAVTVPQASSPSAAVQPLLQAENARLVSETTTLRRELDAVRAQHTCASEELRLAEDRRIEVEERIRQLQNELADTEQELSNVQKKYFTLKNSGGGAAGGGAGGGGAAVGGGTGGDGGGPSRQGSLLAALPSAGGSGSGAAAANGAGGSAAAPAGVTEGGSDVLDEVAELQALLAKRTADLEREREAHLKTRRELQEVQARVGDEAWVPSTRLYGIAQQQLAQLNEALAARARDVEALARERDEALREAAAKASLAAASSEAHMRSKLATLERSYRELQFGKADADRARAEAEATLQRERSRGGNAKTVSELQALVASLQGQIASLQSQAKLDKVIPMGCRVAHERLDASAREVVEAASNLAARDMELQRLRDALARRDGEAEEARRREVALKEAVADLRAFVEVLTTYGSDPRDVVEVRASEAALRAQVAELKQQLQGHSLHATIREVAASEREVRGQLDLVAVEADELRMQVSKAQRQAAEVEALLAHSRSECELYKQEIEVTVNAFEELQVQNGRLVAALAERDEANNAVVAERLKLSQQVPVLTEAAEASRGEAERLQREVSELGAVREALERDMTRLASELASVKEQLRVHASRLESAGLEVRARSDAMAALQQQLEAAGRQLDLKRLALEEADQKHVKEKSKRQRVEEEVKALQTKVEKLKKLQSPAGAARELQEEADAMRQLLNCNVCHERQKNRIITKCCHVFCDVCIDRTLTARNRKCPGCGIVFAKGDIKTFFFT
ncbi:hypothetical protein VOLCADRAFT_92990 [Volvox carteri f. nagariensis]|uniref:E3 ubiquitin protein ligase n=1 Tax=Volvox carteri f. nagariensis TaxID=3068 RepID=D8U116_VOLCA|nr:uncharacterized protein VOLCADRAFT_92990 [Volvox carteri f. nagariensis]EFJ46479.1 hypothetical protein VOLCADRAFT_92990 [Volvox carteri f. nagariensis]|eukprot:XP_002952336.1 hypothetical protein VOLCADRAFT_92990 [Volvox carteri f. nagariensis]